MRFIKGVNKMEKKICCKGTDVITGVSAVLQTWICLWLWGMIHSKLVNLYGEEFRTIFDSVRASYLLPGLLLFILQMICISFCRTKLISKRNTIEKIIFCSVIGAVFCIISFAFIMGVTSDLVIDEAYAAYRKYFAVCSGITFPLFVCCEAQAGVNTSLLKGILMQAIVSLAFLACISLFLFIMVKWIKMAPSGLVFVNIVGIILIYLLAIFLSDEAKDTYKRLEIEDTYVE